MLKKLEAVILKLSFYQKSKVLFFATIFFHSVFASSLKLADEKFEKGLFADAAKLYEQQVKIVSLSDRKTAELSELKLKWLQTLVLANLYEKALLEVTSWKLSEHDNYFPFYVLLKAKILQKYLEKYRHQMQPVEIENEESILKKSPEYFQDQISANYNYLVEKRKSYLGLIFTPKMFLFETKNADFEALPTFYDYLVLELINRMNGGQKIGLTVQALLLEAATIKQETNKEKVLISEVLPVEIDRKRAYVKERWFIELKKKDLDLPSPIAFQDRIKNSQQDQENIQLADKIKQAYQFWNQLKTIRAKAEWYVIVAKLEMQSQNYETAYEVCQKATDLYKSVTTAECVSLEKKIHEKELIFKHSSFNSQQEVVVPVRVRNIDRIFYKVFPVVTPSEWNKKLEEFKRSNNQLMTQELVQTYLAQKPILSSEIEVKSQKKYFYENVQLKLSKKMPGHYVLIVSSDKNFEFSKSFIAASFLWVSDLVLLTQTAIENDPEKAIDLKNIVSVPVHHLYYFNSITGKLEKDVNLLYSYDSRPTQSLSKQTESSVLSLDVDFSGKQRLGYGTEFAALAYKDNSYSFIREYIQHPQLQKISILIEKDRPIYRPGQEVQIKIIALKKVPFGWQLLANKKISLELKDPNYQTIHKVDLVLNDMGNSVVHFNLPKIGALGQFQIVVQMTDPEYNELQIQKFFADSFSVEEYKRPDFFVEIEGSKVSWLLNHEVRIKSFSKYYHGSPVRKAQVQYQIKTQTLQPWFYAGFWQQQQFTEAPIVQGEGVTNEQGEFEFTFFPKSEDKLPKKYIVSLEVRDSSSGRTMTETKEFTAAQSEFLIQLQSEKEFYLATENVKINVELKDLNSNNYQGQVELVLSKLLPPDQQQRKKMKETTASDEVDFMSPMLPKKDLSFYLKYLSQKEIQRRITTVFAENNSPIELSKLDEGFYQLKAFSKDSKKNKTESELYLIVYDDGNFLSGFFVPKLTLVDKKNYDVGQKVRVLFGSSELKADVVLNFLKHQFLLKSQIFRDGKKFHFVEFAAEESYQRNISMNWFGYGENEVIQDKEVIEISPWQKRLDMRVSFKKQLRPGEQQDVLLKTSSRAKEIDGLVKIYDQSLDIYSKEHNDRFMALYAADEFSREAYTNSFYPYPFTSPEKTSLFAEMLHLFKQVLKKQSIEPHLHIDFLKNRIRYDMQKTRLGATDSSVVASDGSMGTFSLNSPTAIAESDKAELKDNKSVRKEEPALNVSTSLPASYQKNLRSDFSETALFSPTIKFTNSQAKVSFKVPDQLTTWNVKSLFFSRDGRVAQEEDSFITNKELMVRIQTPRFYREKDSSEIRVFVENKSTGDLAGSLKLSLEQSDKNVFNQFSQEPILKSWSLKASEQISLAWKIQVPSELKDLKITVLAESGKFNDAEQRIVPILPSRERLIENQLIFLEDKSKVKMGFQKWNESDESRVNELMMVQVEPQLPLMLLNSIPSLINSPYDGTDQLVNKFVPLAILNSLNAQNPQLKKALAKVPQKNKVTLPWEDSDPRRLIRLIESPWKLLSEGLESSEGVISLLDEQKIDKIKKHVFTELENRQLPSGGFSWFPGGKEDLYITLLVLESFSEANKYQVPIPKLIVLIGALDNQHNLAI